MLSQVHFGDDVSYLVGSCFAPGAMHQQGGPGGARRCLVSACIGHYQSGERGAHAFQAKSWNRADREINQWEKESG